MPKLQIDGEDIEVPPGYTILQACAAIGIEIPRFCFHERLSIAGNCRMCLVSLQGSPKPTASCAMPAADGMVVFTDTPEVRKMRRGVMEFLLINHPLDCPICDQGGECDLQDMAMGYGFDRGRFIENKRAVKEKDFGPLIKTSMTRCIHCTRCIRFASEIAGAPELGATGRGENMEVGTFVAHAITSELSGNLIDLCPVGALTSKPSAFVARPWEMTKIESIDVMDAVGSAIRVDVRANEVLRIVPRVNEEINEEWISDKTRFVVDGLRVQRLDRPMVRRDGRLVPADWEEAVSVVADRMRATAPERMAAIAGDLVDCETMFAVKSIFERLGCAHLDCRQDGAEFPTDERAGYLFNTTIAGIERAGACLLIGVDPRKEAAILNARLRKRWRAGDFPIGLVGADVDLSYPFDLLGDDPSVLTALADGSHLFARTLRDAERPMLILGMAALRRDDGQAIYWQARRIAAACGMLPGDGLWNGFNVLHAAAARVGGLDLGFVPGSGGWGTRAILDRARAGGLDLLYLLGADECPIARREGLFIVYQGHHGDVGAACADVVLPGAAYTEKEATFVNLEGRAQRTQAACFPPGDAKQDLEIAFALGRLLGLDLGCDDDETLRAAMIAAHPCLDADAPVVGGGSLRLDASSGQPGDGPLSRPVRDYYRTNAIARASRTMAVCSKLFSSNGEARA